MFDPRTARSLAPGDHLTFPAAPGLRLVATESRRTWTYRYKDAAGGMRQVRLGHWPAMSWSAAVGAWEAARALRAAGQDPRQPRRSRPAPAALTVAALCQSWLDEHEATVTARAARESRRILERDTAPIAHRPAASITRADAYDLLSARAGQPVAAAKLRQTLGAVWDFGLDSGRLPPETGNHWRAVLRGRLVSQGKVLNGQRTGELKRALSDEEVGRLLRWLDNFGRSVRDALVLMLWTGCRGAEVVAMEREEITRDPDGVMWWTIPRAKLKTRRSPLTTDLRVPLVGRAEQIVQRRLAAAQGPWVFGSTQSASGHIEQKALGTAVYWHMPYSQTRPSQTRPRLPVTHWAPHDLRRTARTMLAALQCPAEIAEAILGHQQPTIVATYNRHTYDQQRLEWLRRLSAHLEQCAAQV